MTTDDLLAELANDGWTVSWAFQFKPDHWRVSITQDMEWNGLDQPDFLLSHCDDAPTFAEALEGAMSKRNYAKLIAGSKCVSEVAPKVPLLQMLGLLKPKVEATPLPPIVRRF